MAYWRSFLFLVLSGILIVTTAFGGLDTRLRVVHVVSALPKNSEPMQVQCSATGMNLGVHVLKVGDDYRWTAEENVLNYCEASWGRFISSWHAFQPKRDASHGTVFWLAKDDGLYLSWDNSSWARKQRWESE